MSAVLYTLRVRSPVADNYNHDSSHLVSMSHLQSTEESTVTIHHDESESVVISQQSSQSFGVELVITKIKRGVDGLERLKINVDFLLLALLGDDGAAVDDETIGGDLGVELESVLYRGDGAQH